MEGHTLDEDGEHDEEACHSCLLKREVKCACDCGGCCRSLLIEVELEDAKREPRIAERGSPIYAPPELTKSGEREIEGYLLNGKENDYACVFLDRETNLCGIYETRPLACRLYDCDKEGRER